MYSKFIEIFYKRKIFFLFFLVLVFFDQFSKFIAQKTFLLLGNFSFPVLGNVIKLTYAKNYGAAFSFKLINDNASNNYLFIGIIIIAIFIIIYFFLKEKKNNSFLFSLILSGAIGNLIDRIKYGFVIDFIDCDFPDIILYRWPTFNFADAYISTAIILFFYSSLIKSRKINNE